MTPEKFIWLQRDSNPWPVRCRCNAATTNWAMKSLVLVEHRTGIAPASHRQRRGHQFKSRWSHLNISVAKKDNCLSCPTNCEDCFNLSFVCNPLFKYSFVHSDSEISRVTATKDTGVFLSDLTPQTVIIFVSSKDVFIGKDFVRLTDYSQPGCWSKLLLVCQISRNAASLRNRIFAAKLVKCAFFKWKYPFTCNYWRKNFTVQRALPWPPNKLHIWQLRVNTSPQQPIQRCSTYNCAHFARRCDCQSNSHVSIGGQFAKTFKLLGDQGKARRTVTQAIFKLLPWNYGTSVFAPQTVVGG